MGPQAAPKGHRSLIREVPGLPQGGPAEPGGQQLSGDAGAPLRPQPMGLSFPLTSLAPQLASPHPPLTPILLCPAWGLSLSRAPGPNHQKPQAPKTHLAQLELLLTLPKSPSQQRGSSLSAQEPGRNPGSSHLMPFPPSQATAGLHPGLLILSQNKSALTQRRCPVLAWPLLSVVSAVTSCLMTQPPGHHGKGLTPNT